MAFKGLVDSGGACGNANPLIKLSQHYSKDQAKRDITYQRDGKTFLRRKMCHTIDVGNSCADFAHEFLGKGSPGVNSPRTFNMEGLLRDINGAAAASTMSPPAGTSASSEWSDEFAKSGTQAHHGGTYLDSAGK